MKRTFQNESFLAGTAVALDGRFAARGGQQSPNWANLAELVLRSSGSPAKLVPDGVECFKVKHWLISPEANDD